MNGGDAELGPCQVRPHFCHGSAGAADTLLATRLLVVFETPGPQEKIGMVPPLDPLSVDPLATSSSAVLHAAAKQAAKTAAEAQVKAGRRVQTRVVEVAGSGLLSWGGETVQLNLLSLPCQVLIPFRSRRCI